MSVVKRPVKTEHDVKLEKLRDEWAPGWTDVTRKCKWETFFNCSTDKVLHLLLPFSSTEFVQLLKNHINVLWL